LEFSFDLKDKGNG